jgi:hypothetical protein
MRCAIAPFHLHSLIHSVIPHFMGVRMTENCRFAPVSSTEKLVLLVLADCHNDETGRCFPGLAYLSTVTGLNRRTIQRSIQRLEQAGVICVQRGDGYQSSTYTLPSKPFPNRRSRRSGERGTPVNDSHPTGDSTTPLEVVVSHPRGVPESPKPEWNQKKEPENNQKGSTSPERFAIREAPGDSCFDSVSVEEEEHQPKHRTHGHSHRPKTKAKPKTSSSAEADPRFHEIVTRWHAAYQRETGEAYIFHGGRDGAALKRFLHAAADTTPEVFMERACGAWARYKADRFATKCAQAATLHGFCTCWNDIGQQLKTPAVASGAGAGVGAGQRRTHNGRDERGQRPGEIPTDVSVDHIRRL